MESRRYSYLTSRLRAQIGKLLNREDYEAIMGCRSTSELQAVLAKTRYAKLAARAHGLRDLNDKLMLQLSETFDFIAENIPMGAELVGELRRALGVWCVSAAAKARGEGTVTSKAMVVPPYGVERSRVLQARALTAAAILGLPLSECEKSVLPLVEETAGLHYYVILETLSRLEESFSKTRLWEIRLARMVSSLREAAEEGLAYYVSKAGSKLRDYMKAVPTELLGRAAARAPGTGDLGFLKKVRDVARGALLDYPFQLPTAIGAIFLVWLECYNLNVALSKVAGEVEGGEALELIVL